MTKRAITQRGGQRGVAAVEFALIASVFFLALFGAMELARLLFIWNSTAEATRLGARIAVVCARSSATNTVINNRMKVLVPQLDGRVVVDYLDKLGAVSGTCDVDCVAVTVKIVATSPIVTFIPGLPLSATLPSFATTLSRESMASSIPGPSGGPNPMCS